VRRIEEGEQVRGGIIIPIRPRRSRRKAKSSPPDKANTGRLAPDNRSMSKRVIDSIWKYSGSEIKIDGEELLIMREDKSSDHPNARARHWRQEGRQVVQLELGRFFCF